MIAPLREEEPRGLAAASRQLRRARRVVARSLLPETRPQESAAHPVPAWQAWLLAGWMATTAAVYVALLIGWCR